jgi:hypothetical protein
MMMRMILSLEGINDEDGPHIQVTFDDDPTLLEPLIPKSQADLFLQSIERFLKPKSALTGGMIDGSGGKLSLDDAIGEGHSIGAKDRRMAMDDDPSDPECPG